MQKIADFVEEPTVSQIVQLSALRLSLRVFDEGTQLLRFFFMMS